MQTVSDIATADANHVSIAPKSTQTIHFGHAKCMSKGWYNFITGDRPLCLHCNETIEIQHMTGEIVLQLPSADTFADGERVFEASILFTETSAFNVVLTYWGKLYEHGSNFLERQTAAGELILPSGIPAGTFFRLRSDTKFNFYLRS